MQKASVNRTRKTAEVSLNYGPIPANSLMETQQEGERGVDGGGRQRRGGRGRERRRLRWNLTVSAREVKDGG